MIGRIYRYSTFGLLTASVLLVVFWSIMSVLQWHYGTPDPGDGDFLNTTLRGEMLLGFWLEDSVVIIYSYQPYRSNFTAPWDMRVYGVPGWAWLSVDWVPTYPPPDGPPGGFGNVSVGVQFNPYRMLLLSALLLMAALLPVAHRRGWLRGAPRRGFEAIVGGESAPK